MVLKPLVGHADSRSRVSRAIREGRLPQVLLLTGPAGIGKQRLALWIAQLLYCERPGLEPCGHCRGCRLVLGLGHPDLHWIVPIPRPKAAEPDKQIEEAAEAIAEVLAERRASPLYLPPDGLSAHGMATARLIARRAALTPVEGKRKVFVIGEAERLVPQEANPEAANALLKLLEEPPGDSTFVLTTAEPSRVLPTIRSRAVPLRLGRLTDHEVSGFLAAHLEPAPPPAELGRIVTRAAGSIGAALTQGDEAQAAQVAANAYLESVLSGPAARFERALAQGPWQARGNFTGMLDALAETLDDAARGAVGVAGRRAVPAALRERTSPERLLTALGLVAEAREAAQGNVNPQLLLASLGEDLAEAL
jgi:DNA polymerase III subunit delta'